MARTVEQQIAEATNRLQRLRAKKKTRDTRLKIVVGASIMSAARTDPEAAALLLRVLQRNVKRDVDQKEVATLIEELRQGTATS